MLPRQDGGAGGRARDVARHPADLETLLGASRLRLLLRQRGVLLLDGGGRRRRLRADQAALYRVGDRPGLADPDRPLVRLDLDRLRVGAVAPAAGLLGRRARLVAGSVRHDLVRPPAALAVPARAARARAVLLLVGGVAGEAEVLDGQAARVQAPGVVAADVAVDEDVQRDRRVERVLGLDALL